MTAYRHILSNREAAQWTHINPEIQRWRQRQIDDMVSEAAIEAGCDSWEIYGPDETRLAVGMTTDKWQS